MHFPESLHRLQSLRSELGEVYANQMLFTFAMSLVSVFIPVYVIKHGFSFGTAMAFMAAGWAAAAFLSPLSASLIARVGLKHTIFLSTPLQVAALALLLFSPPGDVPALLLIGALAGAADALYWIALNTEFVQNADRLNRGTEVGKLIALPQFAAIVAPVAAGALLALTGFSALFGIAAILLIASAFPLFLSQDYRPRLGSLRKLAFWTGQAQELGGGAASRFFLQGILGMAEVVLWPLWIFLTYGDLVAVGFAATLSAAGIALFTLFASRRSEQQSLFRVGCILAFATWVARSLSPALPVALALSFIGGLAITLINLAIYAHFAAAGKRTPEPSVVFRHVWLNAGKVIAVLAIGLLLAGPGPALLIGAAVSLALLAFTPKRS